MSSTIEKTINLVRATEDKTFNPVALPETDTDNRSKSITSMNVLSESPRKLKGWLWGAVVTAILSSTFLFALDNTIVADIQPKIIEDLGDIDKLPWVSVSFALGGVSTNLIW